MDDCRTANVFYTFADLIKIHFGRLPIALGETYKGHGHFSKVRLCIGTGSWILGGAHGSRFFWMISGPISVCAILVVFVAARLTASAKEPGVETGVGAV